MVVLLNNFHISANCSLCPKPLAPVATTVKLSALNNGGKFTTEILSNSKTIASVFQTGVEDKGRLLIQDILAVAC